MADKFLGRRLIATARLHRYEREIEAAIGRALARRRAAVNERALAATVTAGADDFDEAAWDTDIADEVMPAVEGMLADLNRHALVPFDLTPEQIAHVLGAIDVESQVEAFIRLITGIGPQTAARINGTLALGVAHGESIPELAARVDSVFQMAMRRAVTIARTETNRAANAGTNAAGEAINAELPLTKTWLATEDDRTRDDHAEADGQTVAFDEMFVVGGEEAEYPCDPNLSAEQSVNCRCTVIFEALEDTPEADAAIADAEANTPDE